MLLFLTILLALALFCSYMYSRSLERENKKQAEEISFLHKELSELTKEPINFSDEL